MLKKILLIDDDEMLRKMTYTLLTRQGFVVTAAQDGPQAIEQLKTTRPDLILLDLMMPNMDGFTVCRNIRANPATALIPIIMLTALDSVENKVKGFEAGADDYLAKPYDTAELVGRINFLIKRAETRGTEARAPLKIVEREGARTIAVFSLRGGAGVTTIAVNLAAGLAQLWEMQVALVDMVAVAGQTALFLNQSLRNTWTDICTAEVINENVIISNMLPHESRVRTLASPRRPEESELLTKEKVKKAIEVLRSSFPYVVLDMPHDLNERALIALEQSDIILIIVQPEIASLRAASMVRELFETLDYNVNKNIFYILNWTFPREGLASKDIERVLKSKISQIIPYAADEFVGALNVGNPPVLANPEGTLGAIFEDIAMAFSKDSQRHTQPDPPSPAWKRVVAHARKKAPK